MLKKITAVILVVCLLITGLSIGVFADDKLTPFEDVLKSIEKKIWGGERFEGKRQTGIKGNGEKVYTVYPTITDAMIKPLIDEYMQQLRDQIASFGALSTAEIAQLTSILKNWDVSASFYWENKKVKMGIGLGPDFFSFTEWRALEKAKAEAQVFFKDTQGKPSAWAMPEIKEALELGLIPEGIMSDYQRPITRKEFVSLMVQTIFAWYKNNRSAESLYFVDMKKYLSNVTATDYYFTDVDSDEVKVAYLMGFINGTADHKFLPDKTITRQEAAVTLANYLQESLKMSDFAVLKNVTDINKAASWAKDSLLICYYNKYLTVTPKNKSTEKDVLEVGTINPLGSFSREQAIMTALRLYNENPVGIPTAIRGAVGYRPWFDFVVSKDVVTVVRVNDRFPESEVGRIANGLLNDEEFRASWPIDRAEQIAAMDFGRYDLLDILWEKMPIEKVMRFIGLTSWMSSSLSGFPDDVIDGLFSGKNHVIDMGWTTVEINGDDFIYKYTLKNNGVHTYRYYEGTKFTPVECKLIR